MRYPVGVPTSLPCGIGRLRLPLVKRVLDAVHSGLPARLHRNLPLEVHLGCLNDQAHHVLPGW
jgi:hypothetical protein